ncbi:MAG: hypothetical protein HFE83_02090 [Lachnospiraceae bacterium]|nr:hypothetical protein [Lachnospiraceae bacterium]
MGTEEIGRVLQKKLAAADKVLIGIGAEWKKEGAKQGAERLKGFLDGSDYYVITSLDGEDVSRLGFERTHMAAPLDVSFTEEEWDAYMGWLGRTLNRSLLILELGEGFERPGLFRWPFEKAAAVNQKACLYRIHKRLYQISEELSERAVGVAADSVEFILSLGEKEEGSHGSDQQ